MGNSFVIEMALRTIIELDIFDTIAKTKSTIAVGKHVEFFTFIANMKFQSTSAWTYMQQIHNL